MLILVIVLVVLWIILAIVGFAIKGLLWLGIIGIVLVIATIVMEQSGARRRRRTRRSACESVATIPSGLIGCGRPASKTVGARAPEPGEQDPFRGAQWGIPEMPLGDVNSPPTANTIIGSAGRSARAHRNGRMRWMHRADTRSVTLSERAQLTRSRRNARSAPSPRRPPACRASAGTRAVGHHRPQACVAPAPPSPRDQTFRVAEEEIGRPHLHEQRRKAGEGREQRRRQRRCRGRPRPGSRRPAAEQLPGSRSDRRRRGRSWTHPNSSDPLSATAARRGCGTPRRRRGWPREAQPRGPPPASRRPPRAMRAGASVRSQRHTASTSSMAAGNGCSGASRYSTNSTRIPAPAQARRQLAVAAKRPELYPPPCRKRSARPTSTPGASSQCAGTPAASTRSRPHRRAPESGPAGSKQARVFATAPAARSPRPLAFPQPLHHIEHRLTRHVDRPRSPAVRLAGDRRVSAEAPRSRGRCPDRR